MKVLIIFLSLMIFSFSFVNNIFAQERIDVVYLKNGSIIKGTIIEQIPNVSIKIETKDGSVFFYKIDEVEKMTKEKVVSSNQMGSSANDKTKDTIQLPKNKFGIIGGYGIATYGEKRKFFDDGIMALHLGIIYNAVLNKKNIYSTRTYVYEERLPYNK